MNVAEALAIVDNPAACVDGVHRTLAAEVRRLQLIEQRAQVVHTTEPKNEHDHTMRGTARYILRGALGAGGAAS